MNFQVNEETYFLGLSDDERKWLVFVATPNGPRRVPVYEDAAPADDSKLFVNDKEEVVN